MTLTSSQLSVLASHAAAGDRIAYYETLASYGEPYAALAIQVALNSGIAGDTANAYFLRVATERESISVSDNQLATISHELMLADFSVRELNSGNASVDDIQRYHRDVFSEVVGASVNAWTAEVYLRSFETIEERQVAWDALVTDNAVDSYLTIAGRQTIVIENYLDNLQTAPFNDAQAFLDLLHPIDPLTGLPGTDFSDGIQTLVSLGIELSFAEQMAQYSQYLSDLQAVGFSEVPIFGDNDSNEYGPYNVALPTGGAVIGGNQFGNSLNGTAEDDVVNAFDGNDTIIGSLGIDRLYGGDGGDLADYSGFDEAIDILLTDNAAGQGDWQALVDAGYQLSFVSSGESSSDTLFNFERLIGSGSDDSLSLTGDLNSLVQLGGSSIAGYSQIDLGTDAGGGDTVDLFEASGHTGVDLVFFETGSLQVDFAGIASAFFIHGTENVIATQADDTVLGNSENNIIDGGGGADVLDGGEGTDFLSFGTEPGAIEVEFTAQGLVGTSIADDLITNFEGVRGGEFNDTLAALDTLEQTVYLIGEGGDDTLIQRPGDLGFGGGFPIGPSAPGRPIIMLGGEGADTFQLQAGVGIMVVQANLDGASLNQFSLDALGLSIDWSRIGAVIVNPDASDTIALEYSERDSSGAVISSQVVTLDVGEYGDINPNFTSFDYQTFLTPEFDGTGSVSDEYVWTANSNFLGGQFLAQGNWFSPDGVPAPEYRDRGDGIIPAGDWFMIGGQMSGTTIVPTGAIGVGETALPNSSGTSGPASGFNFLFGTSAGDVQIGGVNDDWFIASAGADTINGAGGTDRISYGASVAGVSVNLATGFVAGDLADGDVLIGIEDISGSSQDDTLIGDDASNLLFGGAGNDSIVGGAGNDRLEGGSGSDTLTGGEGADEFAVYNGGGNDTITDFNVIDDVLTIDGRIVNPFIPDGLAEFEQVGDDVLISYGFFGGGTILLENVDLAQWTTASTIRGTNSAERIFGTASDDIIAGGGGGDTILAGDGDDRIVYTSGDVLIAGGSDNAGNDTLDLTAFSSADVRFGWDGTSVTVETTGGSVTLQDQLPSDGNTAGSNIEVFTFSDTVLSEADILARLISDQATDGNDTITGRDTDDLIAPGAGNDFVLAGLGNDTIFYDSGDDTVSGQGGVDVLDLSQFSVGDVQISTDGVHIQLATANGTITLLDQFLNAQIESIQFSDGTLSASDIASTAVSTQSTLGDDLIFGTSGNDVLLGLDGNDTLVGRGGDDTLSGGDGNDVFRYTGGHNVITSDDVGTGVDTLDLSQFARSEINVSRDDADAIISTPDGTIRLQNQFASSGDINTIASVQLSDTTLTAQDVLDASEVLSITHETRFVPRSGDALIDGSLFNRAWVEDTIYYSFPQNGDEYEYGPESSTFSPISTAQMAAAHFALSAADGSSAAAGFAIEGFAGIDLEFTEASGAHIRFGESDTPVTAYSYFPRNNVSGGDIWFGRRLDFSIAEAGNFQWFAMLHELGHSMGLNHGHESRPYGVLPTEFDAMEYSLMTYREYVGASPTDGFRNEQFGYAQTYMMLDIATIQHLYGANFDTNSGDTVYRWTPDSGDTFVNGEVAINPGANRIFATIWDGGGVDTYDLSAYANGVAIDLSPGGSSVFSQEQLSALGLGNFASGNIYNAMLYQGDLRSLIENALGGAGDDVILGNVADNTLTGNAGNDLLSGLEGSDVLVGGTGDDTLLGGTGNDTLDGGGGLDTFTFTTGDGNDAIVGFSFLEDILNFDGTIFDPFANLFGIDFTMVGVDTLITYGGGLDSVTLLGFDISTWAEPEPVVTIDGTAGNDVIDLNYVDADAEGILDEGQIVLAGDGNDRVEDGAGDDTVNGGAGRDVFIAGAGADTYDGGADRDEVRYTNATAGLTINTIDGSQGTGIAAGDTFADIEFVHGSNFDDVIVGDVQRLVGHEGNDTLQDGAGSQRLIGGLGADTFRLIAGDSVQDQVNDFTIGEDIFDLSLWGVTRLADLDIFETTNGQGIPQGRLTIAYNGESIRVDGLADADIASLTESHFIFALPPDDDGSGGNSSGGGTSVEGNGSDDIIDANFVDVDGDSISDEGQTIFAGDGDDRIYDGGGDDTVEGGGGRDIFFAGGGPDSYDGGADRDEVRYSASTEGLTINTVDGSQSTGIAAGDTFANIEYVYGTDFDDVIVGDVERIFGLGGNDILQDGAGAQRLIGGAGADTFRFVTGDGAQDRVADFTIGEDVFDLSLWGVTQLSELSIVEATNGQGNLQGRLLIEFDGESLRVDGLATADIASLTDDHFIFA